MKRLYIIFTLLTSGLFGQDNPMFDSLEYFQRNKIKVVHCELSSWYYSPGWKYIKFTFDKKSNSLKCDTLIYYDPSSPIAKQIRTLDKRRFRFKDTVYHGNGFAYSSTIKHEFDKQGRLFKLFDITTYSYGPGVGIVGLGDETVKDYTTTTSYYYADSISKKLKQIITESPYYTETTNFYYERYLLSLRTKLKSSKVTNEIDFESTSYDYYPDRKLKTETRRVASDFCPGIVGHTKCYGSIEYKYETEFKDNITPSGIKPILYTTLLKIENRKKSEVYIEIYGSSTDKKSRRSTWIVPHVPSDSTYEIAFDSRPEKGIYPRNQDSYWYYKKDEFAEFEILVFTKPPDFVQYSNAPKDTLFYEKCKIESLFEKPKTILIKDK